MIERRNGEVIAQGKKVGGIYKLEAKAIPFKQARVKASPMYERRNTTAKKEENTPECVTHEIVSMTKTEVRKSKAKTSTATSDSQWENTDEDKSDIDQSIDNGKATEEPEDSHPAIITPHPKASKSKSEKPKRDIKTRRDMKTS